MTAPAASPTNSDAKDPSEVGLAFAHEYYTFLNKDPSRLHLFYNKKSAMSHGIQGGDVDTCKGLQDIRAKIHELDFEDCRVLVSNIDSQASIDEGIVIQVLGELSNRGGPAQKFVQTFFLAEQPNGYFVLNDIFRYLKDDTEDEEEYVEETEDVAETYGDQLIEDSETVVLIIEDSAEEEILAPEPAEEEITVLKTEALEEKPVAAVVADDEKKSEEKKPEKKAEKKTETKKEVKVDGESIEKQEVIEPIKAEAAPVVQAETVPAAPAPVAPAQPPKAKTWANLAASNSNQWGSHVAPAKAATVNVTPAAPKPQTQPQQTQPQQTQPQPQQTQPQQTQPQTQAGNRPQGGPRPREEYHSIYIKNVTEKMSLQQLREAFTKFGTVKHLEFTQKRNCAFLDFTTPEAMHAALKQNTVAVENETVLAEERRRNNNNQNNNNGPQNGGRPFNPHHSNAAATNGHGQQQQGGSGRGGRANNTRKPAQSRPEKTAQTVAVK